jgi:hypothetical protein
MNLPAVVFAIALVAPASSAASADSCQGYTGPPHHGYSYHGHGYHSHPHGYAHRGHHYPYYHGGHYYRYHWHGHYYNDRYRCGSTWCYR